MDTSAAFRRLLGAPARTRASVARSLVADGVDWPQWTAAFNQEFILQCYRVFLRREPDPDGFAFWLNHINTNGNYIGIVGGFLGSGEYRNRAACGFAPYPCF